MPRDKQLSKVTLAEVVEKRRLDQALNAKEFAVLARMSYSAAREWFHFPGFPVFRGVVFWQDFAAWRKAQTGLSFVDSDSVSGASPRSVREAVVASKDLPARATRIMLDAS